MKHKHKAFNLVEMAITMSIIFAFAGLLTLNLQGQTAGEEARRVRILFMTE